MFNLLTQSYWRDEAFTVLLARRPLSEIFNLVIKYDHTPPLFFYVQHFWISIFGDTEVAVRSLSLLFYLFAAYFVYKLARSRPAALAIGLNPFLWRYALEARHYSAYLFLVLGGVYFFQAGKFVWSNIFWALGLWTHNFTWLYFLVFSIVNRTKKLFPAFFFGALWLPFALEQANRLNQGMWLDPPSGWMWWWESLRVFAGTPLLAGLTLGLLIAALAKPKKLLPVALVPPLLAYLVSSLWVPVYLERYLLPTLPLLLIAGLPAFRRAAIIFVLASAPAFIQVNQQTTKPAMKQAVESIVSQLQPEEIVVTEQPINYLEVYYYLKQSGKENLLYSYLYPGEDHIPYYVGTDLIKPWQEIVGTPEGLPFWLVKPDAAVVRYE